MYRILISLFFCFFLLSTSAQDGSPSVHSSIDSSFYGISASVNIDSITISASRAGFSIQDFINIMLTDESFYLAFKNLRSLSYSFSNNLEFFNDTGKTIASYSGVSRQNFTNGCRSMNVLSEEIHGQFFNNGNYKHYTTRLYDRVFITHGVNCSDSNASIQKESKSSSNIEHQISMLKKMIFSPGVEADLPLVGQKMAIFSDKMSKYYDYSISVVNKDATECYLFSVTLKPEFQERKKKKTIIKHLNTYFAKEDLQVISRNYNVAYKTPLYSFDIDIDILLDKINDKYVPININYDGYWDLPLKKPEIARFSVWLFDFLPLEQ